MKNLKEIKKAALAIGMDYIEDLELVVTDRIKKRTFYVAWDNGYSDSQKKVLKLCKDWKIKHITILKPYTLIGEYGTVLYNGFTLDNSKTYFEYNPKKILKVLRELYNIHKAENKFYWSETTDGLWHLYYMPTGHSTYHYGEGDNDELIIMSNGQVFDVGMSTTSLLKTVRNYYMKSKRDILIIFLTASTADLNLLKKSMMKMTMKMKNKKY